LRARSTSSRGSPWECRVWWAQGPKNSNARIPAACSKT
jgi:hypothetical protein